MPTASSYGRKLDCSFAASFYDTKEEFLEQTLQTAGYGRPPEETPSAESLTCQAEYPIVTRSSVLLWASHLWAMCSSASTARWIVSLSNILKHVAERPAQEPAKIAPCRLLGTPAEARRAPRMPNLQEQKTLQLGTSSALEKLLGVIEEAGPHSAGTETCERRKQSPGTRSFTASLRLSTGQMTRRSPPSCAP